MRCAQAPRALFRPSQPRKFFRDALQDDLFSQAQAIFGLTQTVTLYELTHTYIEGSFASSEASRMRSRRKPQRLHR
ncbi:hypothetical protein ACVBEH_11315 [Roseateles sp. GG27B]